MRGATGLLPPRRASGRCRVAGAYLSTRGIVAAPDPNLLGQVLMQPVRVAIVDLLGLNTTGGGSKAAPIEQLVVDVPY